MNKIIVNIIEWLASQLVKIFQFFFSIGRTGKHLNIFGYFLIIFTAIIIVKIFFKGLNFFTLTNDKNDNDEAD